MLYFFHPSGPFGLVGGVFFGLALFSSYLFPFHIPPWVTFYNEWLFAISIGIILFFVINKRVVGLPSPWVVWLLFAFLLCQVWAVNSGSPQFGLVGISIVYALVCWFAFLVGMNISHEAWISWVLGIVWLAAMVSAIIAVLQWSGIVSGADWGPGFILYSEGGGRVSSNIGQANNLGTLLVLGIAVLGYWWSQKPAHSRLWLVLGLFSLLVLVLGIYLSGSRTALLNLTLWPVLFFAWARWHRQPWPWLVLLPTGLLWGLYAVMPALIEWMQWFPAQEARSLVSDSSRFRLWSMVLKAVMESPWVGHGFGAVANAHLRLSPEFGAIDYSIAQHAHNTVLDMWIVFGLPLGTLIVAAVAWLWVQAWRASRQPKDQFLWLMCTAMLVHGMLEYPLHYGFFLWLLFLLLGALAGKPWKTVQIQHPVAVAWAWLLAFFAVAFGIWAAYVQLERNYTVYRQQGPDVAHRVLAEREFPLQGSLFTEPYDRLWWITTPMDDVLNLSDDELTRLEQTASHYPLPGLGWRMAFAQAARGNAEQAAWWAERMCVMFDPRVCRSAAEEWQRRATENPQWPGLPWERWLPKDDGQAVSAPR